jgi:hypothetical protein
MFVIKAFYNSSFYSPFFKVYKDSLSSDNLFLSDAALLVPLEKAKRFELEIEAINFLKTSRPFISSNWSFVVVTTT